jgi:hypothetical protein
MAVLVMMEVLVPKSRLVKRSDEGADDLEAHTREDNNFLHYLH